MESSYYVFVKLGFMLFNIVFEDTNVFLTCTT
jgi:hypothetical protein